MRIAQLAPLAESVSPKLYGGTERVIAWLVDELVREAARLDRRKVRARFEERFVPSRMAKEYEAHYRKLVTCAKSDERENASEAQRT